MAANPELLERWRPVSESFDIFFGFEAPTENRLNSLNKGSKVSETIEAIKVART